MKKLFKNTHSLTQKAGFIFILALVLQIPLSFISSIVYERDFLYTKVAKSIGEEWGKTQTVAGPALVLVYEESYEEFHSRVVNGIEEKKSVIVKRDSNYIILPDNLLINTKLENEMRARGIYKSSVYTSNLNITGNFSSIRSKALKIDSIKPKDIYIVFGMSDTNSLVKINKFRIGEKDIVLESGTGISYPTELEKGITGKIDINEFSKIEDLNFDINFDLRGSDTINMLPLARNNHFEISSSWKNPSFIGMLPNSKEINDNGFVAKWDISHLVRNYKQEFYESRSLNSIKDGVAGVTLYSGVTHYRQVTRAIKYGMLFIMLSLGIVYIFEISSKKTTHYIQYGVVGISLTLFYLVLLSFSEQISFSNAYIIATAAMAIPNSLYMSSITKNIRYGVGMFFFLIAVYSVLFSILQMEQYALITGVLLVLSILYIIMYLTRDLRILNSKEEEVI